MANRTNTIRVPFTTKLTSLATNTTLAGATRHDFAAATVYMPETTRTIRYVGVELTAADQFGTAMDVDGVRIGVKVNAVAFNDVDYTIGQANTGDHQNISWRRDATSYFVTNDPGTASFTAQVGVAYATGSASNMDGITAVLIITYEYDDSASTYVKTICYPIQSHHTSISTSYVEVGTVSGTSNAPANQILKLTSGGLLPESSITIRHYWIDVTAQSNAAGSDLTLTLRFDGSTDNARYTVTQTLSSNTSYFDRVDLTGLDTTAAHAFEAKSSAASTFEHVGGVVWVTYEYDPTSTTILNSLMMPLDNGRSTTHTITDSTSTDAERWQVMLDIQEPSTITMKQTGVVFYNGANNANRLVLASGQSARTYVSASNLIRDTCESIVHRCDHSSSTWTLARGANRLTFDLYTSVENNFGYYTRGGYAIINYTSGLSPDGVGAHAHTTVWPITTMATTALSRTAVTPTAPIVPESSYKILGSYADVWNYTSNTPSVYVGTERASGEGQGGGWEYSTVPHVSTIDAEVGTKRYGVPTTDWWRPFGSVGETDVERMNLETSRDWMFFSMTGAVVWIGIHHFVNYHSNGFTISGHVEVDGIAVADGETVDLWAKDANGIAELVDSTTTSGGTGTFTFTVLDDTRDYKVTYEDGVSVAGACLYGQPGGLFDIEIYSPSSGSGYSRSRVVNP